MKSVDSFLNHTAEWLRSGGPDHDIVISSRIRLARNFDGFPFVQKLNDSQRNKIMELVRQAASKNEMLKDSGYYSNSELTEVDRQFLVERHLISREHAHEKGNRAVSISPDEVVSMMILEEDHLRMQVFQSGFEMMETWRIISSLDDALQKEIPYIFDDRLGYLTACPTNVGTGMRASCMLHLPGLVLTKQVQKVLQALSKLNLAARGMYGEGTQATGNFFQFSNQMTLGQTEEEMIDNLTSVIRQVIEHEKEARQYLKDKKKTKFEDQVWRALGTLKSARIISSAEATQLLSLTQLGVQTGLIESVVSQRDIFALLLFIQPAHLQKLAGKSLDSAERDLYRAAMIRKRMAKAGG